MTRSRRGTRRRGTVSFVLVAILAGAAILGIVGRDGGYTARVADACVIVPTMSADTITPHTEAFAGVIWHMIVSDPRMLEHANKWESTAAGEADK